MTILTIHDFFSIPKYLRTFFNFLLCANAPTNCYDRNVLKAYLSDETLRTLERLQKKKHFEDEYKAYKAFWFLGKSGFIKTDLVPRVFIRKIEGEGWGNENHGQAKANEEMNCHHQPEEGIGD